MNKAKALVDIILDKAGDISDREDALTYLTEYTESFVIEALSKLILDESEPLELRADASETLALVWFKLGEFDLNIFKKIPSIFQKDICEVLQTAKPEWISIFENTVGKKLI